MHFDLLAERVDWAKQVEPEGSPDDALLKAEPTVGKYPRLSERECLHGRLLPTWRNHMKQIHGLFHRVSLYTLVADRTVSWVGRVVVFTGDSDMVLRANMVEPGLINTATTGTGIAEQMTTLLGGVWA